MESVSHSLLEGIHIPLVDVWNSLTIEASWLQSSGPSLVHHKYLICIHFFVLTSLVSCCLADFLQSKWRESYVAHTTLPLSHSQKCELLVSPGSASFLFDQGLLEKISSQVKEDSFISSSLSMAKMAQSHTFGRGKSSSSSSGSAGSSSQAGPSGYQSPLFQRSASNKRSPTPGRGGGSKRFKGGRVEARSSKSRWGFWR